MLKRMRLWLLRPVIFELEMAERMNFITGVNILSSIDQLRADLVLMINEAVTDLTAAVAKAQAQSNDLAIDELDTQVTQTTAKLKEIAAALASPTTEKAQALSDQKQPSQTSDEQPNPTANPPAADQTAQASAPTAADDIAKSQGNT